MAAVAVHVVNDDVVAAGDGDAVVLVNDDAIANFGIVGGTKVKTIAVMRGGKAVGAIIGRVSGAVVESDVIDVEASAVADTEAVDWVVLDVDVMD